jgi:hypothetical protein
VSSAAREIGLSGSASTSGSSPATRMRPSGSNPSDRRTVGMVAATPTRKKPLAMEETSSPWQGLGRKRRRALPRLRRCGS